MRSTRPSPGSKQVKQFTVLPKKLYEEDGEVTPTMKVKRKFVNEAFSDLIEAMYGKKKAGIGRCRPMKARLPSLCWPVPAYPLPACSEFEIPGNSASGSRFSNPEYA